MHQNFEEAIEYILSLDNWESSPSIEWDPTHNHARMQALLELLGNPEKSFNKIIVGGTNGKGSTTAMICDILSAHQTKTVAFNSPHLFSIKERISINGSAASDDLWLRAVDKITKAADNFPAAELGMFTSFEALTAAAALMGQISDVDFGVFEVGLGGKYDSTNSWGSDIAVLTSISLDHTHILGDTLEEITRDKITIAREGAPLIISTSQNSEVVQTVNSCSQNAGFILTWITPDKPEDLEDLRPVWHKENLALALQAAKSALKERFNPKLAEKAAEAAKVQGRFEIIKHSPYLIRDCAHNPDAISLLIESLNQLGDNWVFVCGFTRGHLHEESIELLCNSAKHVFITEPNSPKKIGIQEIKDLVKPYNNISLVEKQDLAQQLALSEFPNSNLCICGSFYLI